MVNFMLGTLTILVLFMNFFAVKGAINPRLTFEKYIKVVKRIEEKLKEDTIKYLVRTNFYIYLIQFIFYFSASYFLIGIGYYVAMYCALFSITSFLIIKYRTENNQLRPSSYIGVTNTFVNFFFTMYFAYQFFFVL